MKLRSLLCGVLAIAAAVACKPEDVVETPKLDVDKTSVSVTAEAGQATFNVTTNQDWTASADADWVSVNPNNGKASDKAVAVKVTAEDNTTEAERTAVVTVKAGTLSKTVKVTQAAKAVTPGPDPEPEIAWGMMGCFVDNLWSTDVPMTKEGEWIVAKNAQFTELTFKIRGNASWDDATNIGYAPGTEKGLVNAKLSVVTAEYSKANLGGDAADIKLNGPAGTYDVYFSFENLEVYVMEAGYKPGEREPIQVEPKDVTYTVVGTLNNINWNNSAPEGLMTKEGDYYVAKNVPFVTAKTLYDGADQIEFKIVETGTWDGYAHADEANSNSINAEIPLVAGGNNIIVKAVEGAYDVYFDKANLKVWVMTPGYKPGEAVPGGDQPEPEYTLLDGKQWITEVDGMPVLFDFGITEEEMMCVAIPLMDGSGFGLYMAGLYEIVPADAASGVVVFTSYDWEWEEFGDPVEIPYSDLTATSVKTVCEAVFGVTDPITLTVVENPYEIVIDGGNGGGPSGPVEDGEYWFFNSGKVMAPLAEGAASGVLPAEDAVDGASTAKNIFTLTYDPDWSYYTIQDSYGRYLGQTDETGNITVTDVLPTDDTYALYLWCIEPGYGEAHDIYNAAYYYDLTYSAADNNWVLMDGGYEFHEILPVLVKVEN